MGLSDNQYVNSPYSGLSYYKPLFGAWEEWYAWYPVKKYVYVEDAASFSMKCYRWIWLQKINRRRVTHGPVFVATIKSWEYASTMELLKHGH